MNRLKSSMYDNIFVILLFSFMMAIFAPFEIYLSNKGYFFFPGTDMLGISVLCFVIAFVVTGGILVILSFFGNAVYRFAAGCFFGGTIALYLQGNWDATDYGAWNGSEIDWSRFRIQFYIFLCIFIVLILGCGIFSLCKSAYFIKISRLISIFVTAILFATLVVLLITNRGLSKEKEYICTTEDELELSSDRNMLILILDAFDSKEYEKIISSDQGREYYDALADFTYYPDTVTGFSSTDMSLPQIITGEGYKNEQLFGDFLNEAYEESKFINWLDLNGWEKCVYSDSLMPQGDDGFGIKNNHLLKRVASDRKELMYYMYTMVAFRYMPQPIKNHFYFYADNIKGNLNMVKGEYEPYKWGNMLFYDKIDELSAEKENDVFQLIHIEGPHEPFTLTKELKDVDESTYEEECIASLKIAKKLLDKLKEKSIYDDTIVIIMADHGYGESRTNPLLLIKGYNEHHEQTISDKAISYYDLQDAYIKLLNDMSIGEDVFAEITDNERERFICSVPFNTHLNYDTYGGTMKEYVVVGNVRNQGNQSSTGNIYEEKEASSPR